MRIQARGIAGLILVISAFVSVYGQEKVRQIEKRPTKNDPIEVISAVVGNKIFDNENKVLAGKDWLENLTLEIKNISDKPIVYAEVKIQVQPQGMPYPLLMPLEFGRMPPVDFTLTDLTKLEKIKPNESVKISIADHALRNFATRSEDERRDDIVRVRFYFNWVIFDDGTAWLRGQKLLRNSDNKWQDIRSMPKERSSILFEPSITTSLANYIREQPDIPPCRSKNSVFFCLPI